jgi:hypothetical protein
VAAFPIAVLIAGHARSDALRLLRRARWLLMAMAVLFIVATPGERLPGPAGTLGVTADGLYQAAEHCLRLVLLLCTLAILLRTLGRVGLLSGLHALLQPLGRRRERLVVRLMLALEFAESEGAAKPWELWLDNAAWDGPRNVRLAVAPLRPVDRLALAVMLVAATGLVLL